jgi:uncharacterized protein YkwD
MSKKGFWLKSKKANAAALIMLAVLVAPSIPHFLSIGQSQQATVAVVEVESTPAPVVEGRPAEPPTVERLLELTNAERVKAGVKPLVLDERLNKSAQRKADELDIDEGADADLHVNNEGVHGYEYAWQEYPECFYAAENLLVNTYDVGNGISWWMKSETHRSTLLNPRYEYVGYGIKNGYVAQHFCDIDK